MTGSDRLFNSTETSLRAPYAAPRDCARRDAGEFVRADVRAELSVLTPFVPREFRKATREHATRDVTTAPDQERSQLFPVGLDAQTVAFRPGEIPAPEPHEAHEAHVHTAAPTSLEQSFGALEDDALCTTSESVAEFGCETEPSPLLADLPWIDAFVADDPEVGAEVDAAVNAEVDAEVDAEIEDDWPMGEAGKRLDELTQSLTSIDALRARQEAEGNAELRASETSDAEHTMWNEEEWIDIMPMPLPSSASAELNHLISHRESVGASDPTIDALFDGSLTADLEQQSASAHSVGAESAARALEGLAQRVRSGDVQLPAFKPDVAEEAMLAGLLASMLGWRQ